MKRKIFSILLTLVLVCSFSLVTAVPAPVMAEEGTNYSPFGTVLYIWGADHSAWANNIKWWFLGGDGAQWNGYQVTIVNSQWPEFDGHAYLKWAPCERLEWFTLWRDYDGVDFSNQVTTERNDSIGSMDPFIPAAYAIDGWVVFNPEVDTVGDPRETVGNMSHMWYAHDSCQGDGNLEVKFGQASASPDDEHGFYHGWYLELVECGWSDLNGGWYLEYVADDGGGPPFGYMDRYQLYADAEFTVPGIPQEPDKFVAMGGEYGLLEGPRGRFVAPYEVWVDDEGDNANPGTEVSPFATIQKGIGMVASAGTINVEAGEYIETLVVDKQLTLQGAGSGSDPANDTVITSAAVETPVIEILAGALLCHYWCRHCRHQAEATDLWTLGKARY